ncbi:MAG TPA: alpha/beta hydrolase [Steroidobacteraceae bacterium]|nr:alpha/beta hydrolase [Steroidobacteraceae bacterium]
MNRDATFTRASGLTAALCRWLLCACSLAVPAMVAAGPPPSAPARIGLDAFEARKKSVALADGETLAYLTLGDPAGTPVVLIHGYTDSARDWVPLIPYLAPRLRLILVDLRGHGRSGKPECCYTRFDFAYDIKLLLDALQVGRADLVGHSMGSLIAQTFAEFWPERTRRVVLISSSGGRRPGAVPPAPKLDYAAAIRQLKEPIDPDSKFMMEWWSSPTPVDPDFLRRQRQDAAAIPLRVWLAVLDQGLLDDLDHGGLQRTLPRLKAPLLLIWGSADPIMDEESRATLRAALPQAQVQIFPGLGHNPFWEQPAKCAGVINRFLTAAASERGNSS